jgi:hypothetical protein
MLPGKFKIKKPSRTTHGGPSQGSESNEPETGNLTDQLRMSPAKRDRELRQLRRHLQVINQVNKSENPNPDSDQETKVRVALILVVKAMMATVPAPKLAVGIALLDETTYLVALMIDLQVVSNLTIPRRSRS